MGLIAPDELAASLGDPRLRVCDVRWYLTEPGRGAEEYAAGHIPAALFCDLEGDLSTPGRGPGRHPLPSPAAFAATLSGWGIAPHHRVVVYDASGGAVAARLWWMLRAVGHEEVLVLDGGWPAWQAAGLPVSTEVPRHPPTRYPVNIERWPGVVDRQQVAVQLGEAMLLDARAPERYRGEVEPVDRRAGHIPSALNSPVAASLDSQGRFLPPDRLRHRFAELGVDGKRPLVAYCGSGVNACHLLLALQLAGWDGGLLYEGSWSDWSSAGMPVATGPDPEGA